MRAVLAVIAASYALSNLATPWSAIPAGIIAVVLAVGAATGWRPADLLRSAPPERQRSGVEAETELPQQPGQPLAIGPREHRQ
ncbi:hypothetical protein [Microbacterium sp.]|uniref:hypothetical protein n=1 Tax=Microbacterium sp. TaxID=51671 RepID=UPI00341D9299